MPERDLSIMLDARSYSVLEALSSLRDTSEDVYNGFFWPITISQHLRLSVDIVRDEYDLLANSGFVDLKPRPGGERIATLARITMKGDAELASRRKIGGAALEAVIPATSQQHYDIFLSHASDDNEYAIPLYEALCAQFTVFIDKTGLRAGANFPHDIGRTIAASDWGVFLLTPAFMNKGYTREELDTFLHREIQTQRRQTVIVTKGHDVRACRGLSRAASKTPSAQRRPAALVGNRSRDRTRRASTNGPPLVGRFPGDPSKAICGWS